jgi:hypothetical protein
MPGTAEINASYRPVHENAAIPATLNRPLAASEQVGRGQFATVDLSTGHAALNNGAQASQACAGLGDPSVISDVSTIAGAAGLRLSQRHAKGIPASTEAGDGFADTDFGAAFWIADENAPGKLSNFGANDRSIGGLVFGLGDDGNPILWTGPVAWVLARAALIADRAQLGQYQYAGDAAAGDAVAETILPRPFAQHGLVTGVRFVPTAALTADNANNAVITVRKRNGAGGTAVTLATITTDVASGDWVAFTPKALTPTATAADLIIRETDVITVEVAKGGTGVALPSGSIEVIGKVI